MFKTRTVILVVFIAIIFCLALSRIYAVIFDDKSTSNIETSNNAQDTKSETKRETLYAQLDKLDYDSEANKLNLSLSTNIPDSTTATVLVYNSKTSGHNDYITTSTEEIEDGKIQTTLYPSTTIKNAEYFVRIIIDVISKNDISKNKHLTDKLGWGHELEKQYNGNNLVKIREVTYESYTIEVHTKNRISIKNGFSDQEAQQELVKREKEREQQELAKQEKEREQQELAKREKEREQQELAKREKEREQQELAKREKEREQQKQQEVQQSKQNEVQTTTVDANSKGEVWLKLSEAEKRTLINQLISNWKSNGYTVTVGADWFIGALDAFYGTPETNVNTIGDAMTLSGVASGVVKK
ncbi:hypothetical protein PDM87_18600 [Bacillus cereus]|nr:hypothetical protein [Bacillus cereus]